MAIRKVFDQELEVLKDKLIEMGNMAKAAFDRSIEALVEQDMELAQQVIDSDPQINQLEDELEQMIVNMIAAQQPVATDLRRLISALKIMTSLERIGDFAVDIAKGVKRIGTGSLVKPLQDIPDMAAMVSRMVEEGLNAFIQLDADKAREIAKVDDQVDKLYSMIVQDLFKVVLDHPEKTDQVIQLAFISRYIERIADYVTNIAEGILYEVKGKKEDLNQ
jgi:phosphate transport system protein